MLAAATLRPNQKEEKSAALSPLFDQIYAIAKNAKDDKDTVKKLSRILTKDTCIDVRGGTGLQTAASKLAEEGNKEAVDLLIKLGANVNDIAVGAAIGGHRDYVENLRLNHGAHVNLVAYGLAQGGHRDYAENLRLKHGANVNYIAKGAASGGHRDYAEELRLNQGANVNHIARGAAIGGHRYYAEHLRLNHGANATRIAGGAALGGHRDYAEYLRVNHSANVHDIAGGAALGGHRDYTEYLRLNYVANVNHIAKGAALGGHRDYAEFLRINHGANVNDIARGAALGGHRDYAEHLRLKHGANVNYIARGAASGGHRDYAEHLRLKHGANVNDIARGAAFGGYRDYAEHLRLNHGANVNHIAESAASGSNRDYAERLRLNHGANVNDITKGTAGSGDFDNTRIALHSLCFMKNNKYRTQIVQELKDKELVPYDVSKLVPKAERIVSLRPKYNYSQCLALGNQEIQTWYLQCATLIGLGKGKLFLPLFLSISTYLSSLTIKEARDLYDKSRFDMYQKLLVKGIDYYCKQTRILYFFNRDKNAEEFSVVCSEAKNRDQLKRLLVAESDRIRSDEKSQQNNNPDPYKDLITRNLKRLG